MKHGDKGLIDGMKATVLCDVDAGEYSAAYPSAEWADVLKSGILVETTEIGVAHYPDASKAVPLPRTG
jgi:hypothetical protein